MLLLRKIQMLAIHREGKIGASRPFNLFPLQTHLLQPLFNTLKLQGQGKMFPWDCHGQWILHTWNTILHLERGIPSDLMNLWVVTKTAEKLYLWGPLFDWEKSRKRKRTIGHKTPLYFPLIIRLRCGLVTLICKTNGYRPFRVVFWRRKCSCWQLTSPLVYVSFLVLDFSRAVGTQVYLGDMYPWLSSLIKLSLHRCVNFLFSCLPRCCIYLMFDTLLSLLSSHIIYAWYHWKFDFGWYVSKFVHTGSSCII